MTGNVIDQKVTTYLFLNGKAEEAIAFYTKHLGAKIEAMLHFNESPDPIPEGMLPKGFEHKVMHASFTLGNTRIMASDGCSAEEMQSGGFSLALTVASEEEAKEKFAALSDGGKVIMPLSPTFWSPCYGQLTDPFGINWMVMVPGESAKMD